MESERFEDDGCICTLKLGDGDHPSSIEVALATGEELRLPIPALDRDGIPAMQGRHPTMNDLRELAMLTLTYGKLLSDMPEESRCKLAEDMDSSLTEDSPTFAWLRLVRSAVEAGVLGMVARTTDVRH